MTAKPSEQRTAMEVARARVGTAVNAKWRLDALLGVGGMATVYAATHRNGSRAAVKILHGEYARDEGIRGRFLREGRIANRVDHPARVVVSDDDVSDSGEPFLVMELLDGESLDHVIARQGKLSLGDVFTIFDPVLDLLGCCHEAQIVHRDIKPANLFVCASGAVKVLDFGVARMQDPRGDRRDATAAGTILGSAAYMAPEQALGATDGLDGRADVFSVGACIYHALSGARLNQAPTIAEQFVLAATQPAPSIAVVVPDLPVEIVAFVDRALAYERSRRFESARAARAELVALASVWRAGRLSAPTLPRAGVVVRANDQIEEGPELAEQAREATVTQLQAVWRRLTVVMASVRQYGWMHPQTPRALEQAHRELGVALAAGAELVRWEVTPYAFTFGETPVWEPDRAPFDRIPYNLFATGLRRMQLKVGFTEEELRDLVAILVRAVNDDDDDDSVTAFWDRHFEHLAYLAVDSFAEGSLEDREHFETDCAAIASLARAAMNLESVTDGADVEARALYKNLSATLRAVGDAAAALVTDAPTRVALGAQANLPPHRWHERFVDAFTSSLIASATPRDRETLLAPLGQWASETARLARYADIFGLYAQMLEALAVQGGDAAVTVGKASLGAAMYGGDTLAMIVTGLSEEHQDADVDPSVAEGLTTAMEVSGDGPVFDLVADRLERCTAPRLRAALLSYVARWAGGHEIKLSQILPSAGEDIAVTLLDVVGGLGTSAADVAVDGALQSPHVAVRAKALAIVLRNGNDRSPQRWKKLIEDPDATIRIEALKAVTRMGITALGSVTLRRVGAADFNGLTLPERWGWLTALVRLIPGEGTAAVVGLLRRWQWVPNPAVDGTRVVAARVLGESGSPDALGPLRSAARWAPWNSRQVREAASQAMETLSARLGSGTPGTERRAP